MNEKNKAKELLEKFTTKRDALIAIDMLILQYIAIKGIEDPHSYYLERVKIEILNK
jgi:hypothetical protein